MTKTTAIQLVKIAEHIMTARELVRKIQRNHDLKADRENFIEYLVLREKLESLLTDRVKEMLDKAQEVL